MKYIRDGCALSGTMIGTLLLVASSSLVSGHSSTRKLASDHRHQYDFPASVESAERFFSESNVTLHYDLLEGVGNLFRVTATTPLPIFCAIVWKYHDPIDEEPSDEALPSVARHSIEDEEGVIEMQVMSEGATVDHNIFLWSLPALDDGESPEKPRRIDLRAYGFLSNGRVVFISPTYQAMASKDNPSFEIIGPGDVVSPELNATMTLAPIIIEDSKYVKTPNALGMKSASAFAVANTRAMLDNATMHDSLTVFRSDAPLDIPVATIPSDLEPDNTYVIGGNLLYPTGKVQLTEVVDFVAPPKIVKEIDPCMTKANLTVTDVSSNWGATEAAAENDSVFGADNAVDGDVTTAWSSNMDGDEAYLVVKLDVDGVVGPYDVASVGYWSRMMTDGTSIVKSFRVVNPDDGTVLVSPVCPLSTFTEMHSCSVTDSDEVSRPLVTHVRFEVVASTGGNTGAMEVEVLVATPNSQTCLDAKRESSTAENGSEEGSADDGMEDEADDGVEVGSTGDGIDETSSQGEDEGVGGNNDTIKASATNNDGSEAFSLGSFFSLISYVIAVVAVLTL